MGSSMQMLGKQLVVLRAGGYSARAHVFAPPLAALRIAGVAAAPSVTAPFEVTFTGFSEEARTAFQAAIDVWSVILTSSVSIRVDAQFSPLGAGVLGQAGPATVVKDFAGAPRTSTWYPIALANRAAGSDLAAGGPHISAEFSSNFTNWYFGTDGETPEDRYDMMSVVLHELGHGLGFVGSMRVAGGTGRSGLSGFPLIYDRFTVNLRGQQLLDTALFPNPSAQLAGQLQSNFLFFDGPQVRTANANQPVRIYAPITFEEGSSFSHLDETVFAPGSSNSLMTPQIGMSEAIHAPGAIGLAVLRDLGW